MRERFALIKTIYDTIQTEHADLEALIAPLSETQLCSPSLEEGWSIKDILAHIADWERLCTEWLEDFMQGQTPPFSEEMLTGRVNDQFFLENRNRPLHEVQEDFRLTHEYFLQKVTLLVLGHSEEELTTPFWFARYEPWLFWVEPQGRSLLAVIADYSYHHYRDHAQQIRRSLDAPAT
jgi:hypothetical protein